ncbi:hypothetical protein SAMN02910293_00127 [Streptococcus henryi]|jgi:hypothetical protein|uniref:Uncharacterized protein n=1 Tax=Streptococcus henryi TaxID=439219 RepID=A0A1G6A1P9_9STRE|nr:hypothetical protein [Streptococcus henryi]SDB02270.1 hypothetical protein SAMN02910293_00127 [Streptococcus henryi]
MKKTRLSQEEKLFLIRYESQSFHRFRDILSYSIVCGKLTKS